MTDPEVFIVRIWRQLASGFRASARRVDDDQTRYFSEPDEVARFLQAVDASNCETNLADPLAGPAKPYL